MAWPALLLSLLLLIPTSASPALPITSSSASAAAALQSHGLPAGLLPRTLADFRLGDDGRFEAALPAPCTARFDAPVRYNASLAGALSPGRIANLSGVAAQELFLWFPVLGVHVDLPSSGVIYVDVGVVNKRLAASLFETPPDCSPDTPSDDTGTPALVSLSQSGKPRNEEDQQDAQLAAL